MYDQARISDRPCSYQASCSSKSSFSSSEGNCSADLVVCERESDLPIVVFECKGGANISNIEKGMIQLVSYGLSLQHKRKLAHSVKLVLITPRTWYVATVPPYQTEISEIRFMNYVMLKKTENETFFDRKAYIAFLIELRQHFESVSQQFSSQK